MNPNCPLPLLHNPRVRARGHPKPSTVYTCIYIYICICVYIYIYMYIYIYIYIHIYIFTYIYIYINMYIYIYIYIYTYIHTYTYIYLYIYLYTYILHETFRQECHTLAQYWWRVGHLMFPTSHRIKIRLILSGMTESESIRLNALIIVGHNLLSPTSSTTFPPFESRVFIEKFQLSHDT